MSNENGGHYYALDGTPMHTVPKKDGTPRNTTIADARKLNLLPSVTQVLKILDKPSLRQWMIRQAVYAVTTAPDVPGESLDDKIVRILDQEAQQDEESQIAMDRGTQIHAALENYFLSNPVDPEMMTWVGPCAQSVCGRGQLVTCEKVLVGKGYAGKVDLILECPTHWLILDWKSCKKLPEKGAWLEHRLQAAAYAAAYYNKFLMSDMEKWNKPIRTANAYICTIDPGQFIICDHDPDWQKAYQVFDHLLQAWCYINSYTPKQ